MEKITSLAKRRGFIFPGSEIYGGLQNSWDYGPLGTELKNNIKQEWWRRFVHQRTDMVGVDAALIMNTKVWEASGHLKNFSDPLVECKKCHHRYRADQLTKFEYAKTGNKEEIDIFIEAFNKNPETAPYELGGRHARWVCENCEAENEFARPEQFNLMLKTHLGPSEEKASAVYFRPETAQAMFVQFKNILETTRKRLPFGIAQIGKAFRNEITPGNFIFRTREFEQMEIEYFVREDEWEKWFEHWLKEIKQWVKDLGIKDENVEYVEIAEGDRAHYSKRTVDIEYKYPFGQKELYGLAYRGDFDLKSHMEASGEDLTYTDPSSTTMVCKVCGQRKEYEFSKAPKGEVAGTQDKILEICEKSGCGGAMIPQNKFIPHVIEPSFGVDRSVLVAMLEAYTEEKVSSIKYQVSSAEKRDKDEDEIRVVMKFPTWLAPVKVAILPLSKKEELAVIAKPLYAELAKQFVCDYDETQSIGKRYRRQDEIGTPFCVTIDFETINDKAVTVRDRDSMLQERIKISGLATYLHDKLK